LRKFSFEHPEISMTAGHMFLDFFHQGANQADI